MKIQWLVCTCGHPQTLKPLSLLPTRKMPPHFLGQTLVEFAASWRGGDPASSLHIEDF